jgi:hypothetical protein
MNQNSSSSFLPSTFSLLHYQEPSLGFKDPPPPWKKGLIPPCVSDLGPHAWDSKYKIIQLSGGGGLSSGLHIQYKWPAGVSQVFFLSASPVSRDCCQLQFYQYIGKRGLAAHARGTTLLLRKTKRNNALIYATGYCRSEESLDTDHGANLLS